MLDNQSEILIGNVKVPIIKDEGITYYPISFIMEKVLLKKTSQGGLQKDYSQYIKKYKIDYGLYTGSIQNVYCISEEGLKQVLNNSKIGRLSIAQRKAMNVLLEYLHMDVISEDDRFLKRVSEEMLSKWNYNEYIKDCITYVLEIEPDIVWQKCSKCNNYYPYHVNFFGENQHSGKEYPLNTICKSCAQWDHNRSKTYIKCGNNELSNIFNKYGEDAYKIYRDHKVLEVYSHWIANKNYNIFPKVINNEEDKITIVKDCYNKGMFKKYPDIISKFVYEVCKFKVDGNNLIQRINKEIYGVDIRHGKEYIDSIEDAKRAFKNYINKHNIIINDVYTYKYEQLMLDANLIGFLRRYGNNLLGYIMELYDNQYPAYKFKVRGGDKYWKVKENRIKALKYFIEEDMKVQLEKVPLYITLTALRNKGGNTMYNVCKKYYSSLFEWVNEVYPEKFDPKDFDIHYVRNNFDSIEEAEIHDILKKKFRYVIYNPNNTDRTIKIDGKVPDWFVFTNKMCYIVEYFGLLVNRETDNSRINDYKERAEDKIEKYDRLDGYGKVYILPEDLKDNFNGLKGKLELIK